jgi:RND family efflux transporter MFP subunit
MALNRSQDTTDTTSEATSFDYADTAPHKPQIKWIALAAIGVLLVAGAFFKMRSAKQSNAGGGRPQRAEALPTVRVVPVRVANVASTLLVTGTLRSNQDVNLSSKISGRVASVYVKDGDRIVRGQLLLSLETDDLRAQVAQAAANLKSAQVRRLQSATGLPGRVQQVLSAIQQAEANYSSADARYRQAVLQEPARVQQTLTAIEQAQANYQTAQARLRQAQLNEPARVQQAQGGVSTAQETVRTAQARLNQAQSTARQTEQQVNAEVAGAESLVAARQAALAEVRRGSRAQQIAQAQAAVRLAEAQLANAQTELNRQRTLFEGGAAPRAALEAAQTQYDVARAQTESARQNLSLVQEGSTNEQIRQAEEAVNQAQAQLIQAQAGRARIPVSQAEVTAALAAVSQAQENLRTAQANLSQIPITQQETRVAFQAVQQARAALDAARADAAQIPITRQQTRIARQDVEVARANLSQARANRSQIPVARQDVLAADASVEAAAAQLQQARVNLGNAQIYSPVNGVVNTKQADTGEAVGPGTTLLNLVALDSVYFEAVVSEANLRQIAPNQPVSVTIPAVSSTPLAGNVTEIIPVADPKSRQFRVRVTIPDPQGRLTPGAFARASVQTRAVYKALTVPTEAIIREEGRTYALVAVQEGKSAVVDRRIVKVGLEANGKTQVLGGLQSSDRVIVGNTQINDNDKVQTVQG